MKGTKEFVVAEPVGHLNLAIFPIVSAIPVEHDRFVTLDEGFKAGTVQVFEVGAEPRQSRETGQAGRTATSQPPSKSKARRTLTS